MNVAELQRQACSGDANAQLWLARQLIADGKGSDAEGWLRKATDAGNVDAMMTLGECLLSHAPPVPPSIIEEARNFIVTAAHNGHGAAAHFVSLLTAVDPALERNWTYALAYLGRAAKSGHIVSQLELAFLANDDVMADAIERKAPLPLDTWQRLHDSIDLPSLMPVPMFETVSADPDIAIVRGFMAPRLCDWIIRRAQPKLEPARTYDRNGGGSVDVNRTNTEMRFPFPDLDLAIVLTLYRIGRLTGVPINGMEPTSVLHYAVGQKFQSHYDFLDPRIPAYASEIEAIGQRHTTFLVYLNDDFKGGETEFSHIGYRFKGRKGDAIMFRNISSDGRPDYRTLHAGLSPTSGEKWILSQWIRGRKFPGMWGQNG